MGQIAPSGFVESIHPSHIHFLLYVVSFHRGRTSANPEPTEQLRYSLREKKENWGRKYVKWVRGFKWLCKINTKGPSD